MVRNDEESSAFSVSPASEENNYWYTYSSATEHMTFRKDCCSTFQPFSHEHLIRLGDNTSIVAEGKGNIITKAKMGDRWTEHTLIDVFYVPVLGRNLFSVGAATGKGKGATFDGNKVILMKNR